MSSDAEVDPRVVALVTGRTPVATERGRWPSGHEFELTSYLTDVMPPLDLVTSVRAIVVRRRTVLVFDDDVGPHIIPGGRVEAGELPLETLARELREEIGCEISGDPVLMGWLRFHHVGPKPEGYRYRYPDDFQLMYLVRTSSESLERDGEPLVRAPRFVPLDDLKGLRLPPAERAFLTHPLLLKELGTSL